MLIVNTVHLCAVLYTNIVHFCAKLILVLDDLVLLAHFNRANDCPLSLTVFIVRCGDFGMHDVAEMCFPMLFHFLNLSQRFDLKVFLENFNVVFCPLNNLILFLFNALV